MKKGIIADFTRVVLLALACIAFVSSCSDDEPENNMIWDFDPFDVEIKIVDADGINLLNLDERGNWMDAPFEMEYDSKIYSTEWLKFLNSSYGGAERWENQTEAKTSSRHIQPIFHGLRCVEEIRWMSRSWEWVQGNYMLNFGEFDPCEDFSISMKLLIPEHDTPVSIKVTNRFWWEGDYPKTERHIFVDGNEIAGLPITIELPRRAASAG